MLDENKKQILRAVYYNADTGFGGGAKLYRQVKDQGITMKEVKEFLSTQSINQINKRNKGRQGSFIPTHPLQEFQVDTIYLPHPALNKGGFKQKFVYGVVAIDTFTKMGAVELIKHRNADETTLAMKRIIQTLGKPDSIYCDDGSEYVNLTFKNYVEGLGIELIFTHTHATMVERFNRTVKELIFRYMEAFKTKTYYHKLSNILRNYNTTMVHRTIRMTPILATRPENKNTVQANIIAAAAVRKRETIVVGDRVRTRLKQRTFDKGYAPKWSKTVFMVSRVVGKYYVIDPSNDVYNELRRDRTYLRAHIQKIGKDVEENLKAADLKGTLEGRLKEQGKFVINETSNQEKIRLDKQFDEFQKEKLKRMKTRVRRKNSKYSSALI